MTIKVYQPGLQVTLIKLVARKDGVASRYTAAKREIDLTPYLGDAGVVRTVKDIAEPTGGFTIAFADKLDPDIVDTVYSYVEPMDMIEIRAARQPEQFVGGKLPLIMRGFVSGVRRTESIAEDGTPRRLVVVNGQDAGKLWLIYAIWFELATVQEKPMLTQFSLQAALGIAPRVYSLSDFVTAVTLQVVNPKIEALSAFANRQVAPFTVRATVKQGQVIPEMAAAYEGPIWNLIQEYAERPWNELFTEDTEDGPVLVFRPTPFKDITGKLIMPGAEDPGTIDLDIVDVASLDVSRSDARIANFFWVPPGNSMLDNNQLVNVQSLISGQPLDFNYGNNAPELYGARRMVVPTRVIPTDQDQLPIKQSANERAGAAQRYIQWHLQRMQQLKAMNRDNGVFESCVMVVKGDEGFKPGRYLRLTRGDLISESYLMRVAQSFLPLQTWTTSLAVERGTGFLERNKYSGSPYLAEGRMGPYSNAVVQ